MDIEWLGHGTLRLRTATATILFDPPSPSHEGAATADVLVYTTPLPGDAARHLDGAMPFRIAGPGEYEVRGVFVVGVAVPSETAGGDRPAPRFAYTVEADGVTVAQLRALDRLPSQEELEPLGRVDVLIVPVGEASLRPTEAVELAGRVEPAITIPMSVHGRSSDDPGPVERFLSEMGVDVPDTTVAMTVEANSVPVEPQVVLLSPVA